MGVQDVRHLGGQLAVLGGGEPEVQGRRVSDQHVHGPLGEVARLGSFLLLHQQRDLGASGVQPERHPAGEQLGEAGDEDVVHHPPRVQPPRIASCTRATCARSSSGAPVFSITKSAAFSFSWAGSWAAIRARASASGMPSRAASL